MSRNKYKRKKKIKFILLWLLLIHNHMKIALRKKNPNSKLEANSSFSFVTYLKIHLLNTARIFVKNWPSTPIIIYLGLWMHVVVYNCIMELYIVNFERFVYNEPVRYA